MLTTNIFEGLGLWLDLKFEDVSYEAQNEMLYLFLFVTLTNYILERGLKYLKYKTWYGWI